VEGPTGYLHDKQLIVSAPGAMGDVFDFDCLNTFTSGFRICRRFADPRIQQFDLNQTTTLVVTGKPVVNWR